MYLIRDKKFHNKCKKSYFNICLIKKIFFVTRFIGEKKLYVKNDISLKLNVPS